MKFNLKCLLTACLIIFTLIGCSTIQKYQSDNQRPKEFTLTPAWVRNGPTGENIRYRKISRMKPIIFQAKDSTLLIQGNSLDSLVAYNAINGNEVWRLPVINGVEASATLINDRLFVGALDGQLYALNAASGQVLWSFPTRAENLAEPLLNEGILYIQAGNNSVYAIDASNGSQVWFYTKQDPNTLSIRGGSKPAIKNGTLYVGFSDGFLVALNAQNGSVKWERQLNKNKRFKDIDSDPLVDNEFLYITGYEDKFYCLRSATGETAWKFEKGGYGSILSLNDKLIYSTSSGEVIALDKSTGQKKWSFESKDGVTTPPTLYKGLVVTGESFGSLKFLDSGTGKIIGSFNPGKGGILSPIATDETLHQVYFISGESNVYSLKANWEYPRAIQWLR